VSPLFPRVSRLSRRQLLGGTALGLTLAPFVPLLARGAEATAPKRLIFLYSSNGTVYERWKPSMGPGGLVLSDILEPLNAYRERLLVVGGLDYKAELEKGVKGASHEGGICTSLTGAPTVSVGAGKDDVLASGPSVDQFVAKRLDYRTVQLGLQVDEYTDTICSTSYAGPQQPLKPNNDPYAVFKDLFGTFTPKGTTVDPALALKNADRQSVIDLVRGDLDGLKKNLGASEQAKLDAHLTGLRELEKGLAGKPGASSLDSCKKTDVGSRLDVYGNDNIPALGSLAMNLVVDAMACDLIRGATIQFGRAGANHRFTWLGDAFKKNPAYVAGKDETEGIHSFAHDEDTPSSRDGLVQMHRWYAGQMKALMDRLAAIPEGAGSMLDNTLVVWFNELGKGGSHSIKETPWVLGGNVGGYFKTNQFLDFPGQPHNRLLLSLVHGMGITDQKTFGDPDFCAGGPLPGLSA
jgi:Protein of unknown function (DUF1552)